MERRRRLVGSRKGGLYYALGGMYIALGFFIVSQAMSILTFAAQMVGVEKANRYFWPLSILGALILATGLLIILSEGVHHISESKEFQKSGNNRDILRVSYWKRLIIKFPLVFMSILTTIAAVVVTIYLSFFYLT
jgi:hypothetical protein